MILRQVRIYESAQPHIMHFSNHSIGIREGLLNENMLVMG
jgi:hypothetical protein